MTIDPYNPWRRVSNGLPTEDRLVEVCGDSGMSGNPYFLTYAIYSPKYRPLEPWRNVQLDALSECGWEPLYWRYPEQLPDMTVK